MSQTRAQIEQEGYCIVKGLLTVEEVNECKKEIRNIIEKWYETFERNGFAEGNDWEEICNRLPSIKDGSRPMPSDKEMSIRRLFRMAVHTEYFRKLAQHPKITPYCKQYLGEDVKLLQSMSLLKPPGSSEKIWHQDNAYFRLTPCKVMGCWIALDEATVQNGCMHVLPRCHKNGVWEHSASVDFHIDYGIVDIPDPSKVVPIELSPGDALLFDGELPHYTPKNSTTDKMRRAIQFHYASSACKPTKCPPKEEQPAVVPDEKKVGHFDCAPCIEPIYWYYRKAELLVCGKDYGGDHI
ncbi:phytanoyl-CoA dioxygenase domain-containing protein 1-like [Dysidea avara]|uniref:phytanoyl-CoA dioxygenase domain-containing protein 1-like n=1 Tax=Dysidea avara TaxID=196820 RepID=UPI00332FCE4E